jgi:predicted peptidase
VLPWPGSGELPQAAINGRLAEWRGRELQIREVPATVTLAEGIDVRPSIATGFLNRSVSIDGTPHRYQVYVPPTYRADTAWPVIVFLHGSGESGTDGERQAKVGLGAALRLHPDRYPAIVVFPQTPSDKSGHAVTARIALAALDQTLQEFATDAGRVYLTGLSMGGSGAWYLAYEHPERFAALVPICGWVAKVGGETASAPAPGESPHETLAKRLKQMPVWIYHGESDTVVPVEESRKAFAALKAEGADVRYTEFVGGNHNAWDVAYRSEQLPAWLLKMRRPSP